MGAIWGACGCRPAEVAGAMAAMSARLEDYGLAHPGWAQGSLAFGARSWPGHAEAAVAVDEEARIALVADVRLDDRASLCDALGVAPAARARTADPALLLCAYKRWGEGCAERLTGEYAFAVWDGRKDAVVCFRSPLGERPFYYAFEGGVFAFGTAIGAVLAAPGVADGLDEGVVAAHLVRPYQTHVPGRTWFRAVRRLPAGHGLAVRGGNLRTFRHWRPEAAPMLRLGGPDAYAEALLELLTRAVADRLRGGPIASGLSGGLDSSAVSVLAERLSRAAGRPTVPTFTWLPHPPTPLPASWAGSYSRVRSVAEQERLRVSYCGLSTADNLAVYLRDGAYPEGNDYPENEAIYRQAREQGMRVLLSGALGDEFASCNGYWHDVHLLASGRWLRLLARCRSEGAGTLKRAAKGVRHELDSVRRSLKRRLWESRRHVNLANREFWRRTALPPRPALQWYGGVRHRQLGFLRAALHVLGFEVNAAAAACHGIEWRHPLADRRVIEFALGVPPDVFRREGEPRWLMRQALRPVLPEDVRINRDKTDPALRSPEMVAPMLEALAVIRQRLAVAEPSRARYMDMAKFLAGIDETLGDEERMPRRFNRALRFVSVGSESE